MNKHTMDGKREVTKAEELCSTWQLISRLEGPSVLGVTEKTGF